MWEAHRVVQAQQSAEICRNAHQQLACCLVPKPVWCLIPFLLSYTGLQTIQHIVAGTPEASLYTDVSCPIRYPPISTEPLCSCLCRDKAQQLGRRLVAKLKEQLSQNLFEVAIQAAANGKVVARETLKVSPLLYTRQLFHAC